MKKIVDYVVMYAGTAVQLEAEVRRRLALDWTLYGSLAVRDGGCLYQPMVKYEEVAE